MLALTRKVGQSIVINDDIKVTVTRVDGLQVHLAIDAPRSIPVHREEIQKRINAIEKRFIDEDSQHSENDQETTKTRAILRPKEVAEYLGMSVNSIYKLEKRDPTFPRHFKLSKRASGWRKSDLQKWLQQKANDAALNSASLAHKENIA